MSRDDERLKRTLRNMDKIDRMEQKLGVSESMTRLRDERASRTVDRSERNRQGRKR